MISKDKQYKTREGEEVRIYATDGAYDFPIHGAVLKDEGWEDNTWKNDGGFNGRSESYYDLIEIVPKVKVWVEYCLDENGKFYTVVSPTQNQYIECKAGSDVYDSQTHLKVEVFEYEPKPETK
jgi:hypothetical protein